MRSWTSLFPIAVLLLIGGGWGVRQLLVQRAEASIAEHWAEVTLLKACTPYQRPPPPTGHPWGTDNFWDLLHPALDALWTLQGGSALPEELTDVRPDERKISDETLAALQAGEEQFEACRQAVKRPVRDWKGPLDELLHWKGRLAGRDLCLKGLFAWRQGRDAEAVDWILAALTVAQETARFDAYPSDLTLREVEQWATEAGRRLLSGHRLSAAQLDDFGRRLGLLMRTRPRSLRQLRWFVATDRDDVLTCPGNRGLDLGHAGWRDLGSPAIKTARILTGLRDLGERSATLPWTSSAELDSQWAALGSRCRNGDVERIWLTDGYYWEELEALLRLDLLRIAVGVARFEASQGRMPATLAEAGVSGIAARPVLIVGRGLVVQLLLPGETHSRLGSGAERGEPEWTIRRR